MTQTSFLIETRRLQLRWLTPDDAAFIYRLVNDPDWIRFIGDKSVADLAGAEAYLQNGPLQMYRQHGYGLNHVSLKANGEAVGICGLLQRENLSEPDLGFAMLSEHRRQGYTLEASNAILDHAQAVLGMTRIGAILSQHNLPSRRLLEKLGFEYAEPYQLDGDPEWLDLHLLNF